VLSIEDIDEAWLRAHGPIHMVIAGWPCQGFSRAGKGEGLQHLGTALFLEMMRVLTLLRKLEQEERGYP